MKQLNLFKTLLFAALLGTASATVQAQNYHPLAFGTMGGAYTDSNWYKDYVGLNMTVSAPASVAGSYLYTYAYGSGGTGTWGGAVTSALIYPLKAAPAGDSSGCSSFITYGATYFAGSIALIWRGPESGACDFSSKAYYAQQVGAVACVLINEYAGEGPVAMALGTPPGTVTIPVFQIGNIPGIALWNAVNDGVVTMTISPWGSNLGNNLGFVPGGIAFAHDFAVPADQLTGGTSPYQYMGLDGAFVANYGTKTETNVKVAATLQFGSSTVNTDTTDVLASFPPTDSIWAMFVPNLYNISAPAAGEYTLTYSIISDSTNDAPGDSAMVTHFWATDSVYSKGGYDVVNGKPLYSDATGPSNTAGTGIADFVWGNMYHVNNGGDTVSSVQFSLNNSFTGLFSNGENINVLIFQWNDVAPQDSVVETGELNIVGLASYTFNGTTDSSGTVIKTNPLGQLGGFTDSTGTYSGGIPLLANSNYYVAVNSANGWSIYYDGQIDPYPRVYGRFKKDGSLDYSNIDIPGDYDVSSLGSGVPGQFVDATVTPYDAEQEWAPLSFFGAYDINAVDSFNYNSQKGLIPAVALITTKTPPPAPVISGVKTVTSAQNVLNVFPIPTSNNLTVSLNLAKTSPTVTYTIIDGLARVVSTQKHTNVLSEQFDIPTVNLAAGNYFLIVNANGTAMSRKFVVLK